MAAIAAAKDQSAIAATSIFAKTLNMFLLYGLVDITSTTNTNTPKALPLRIDFSIVLESESVMLGRNALQTGRVCWQIKLW